MDKVSCARTQHSDSASGDTFVNIITLSHEVTSGSDIMPCIKIDKLLVVNRFCYIT